MKFVDEVSITVSSGRGGPGCVGFLRASGHPRGGPDGGDGGSGGHVIIRVNPQLNTLLDFRYKKKFSAQDGLSGEQKLMTGRDGEDLILQVPPGTIVRDHQHNVLFDLSEAGESLFLKGGRGGKGNHFFRSSTNQAPEYAQPGEDGQSMDIVLELKLIADVGVIGYPNAGKSTLISRISAARPKIADYPFTTLSPNLGVVRVDQDRTMVVADIPGLVPGAHKGVGLGTQFLRHIERTNYFVHLIDASGLSGRDAVQDYKDINHELAEYDKRKLDLEGFRPLSEREQIVVCNKIDTMSEDQKRDLAARFAREKVDVRFISAVSGQGIQELVFELGRKVFENKN